MESAQTIPILLSLVLNDYIYESFGYEEEDFMKNMSGIEIYKNPEIAETFKTMEGSIMKLMQSLEIIPDDISKMMMAPQGQEMEDMMQQMMANMDPNMLNQMMENMNNMDPNIMAQMMGGQNPPPGTTNPMEMLQQMMNPTGKQEPPK